MIFSQFFVVLSLWLLVNVQSKVILDIPFSNQQDIDLCQDRNSFKAHSAVLIQDPIDPNPASKCLAFEHLSSFSDLWTPSFMIPSGQYTVCFDYWGYEQKQSGGGFVSLSRAKMNLNEWYVATPEQSKISQSVVKLTDDNQWHHYCFTINAFKGFPVKLGFGDWIETNGMTKDFCIKNVKVFDLGSQAPDIVQDNLKQNNQQDRRLEINFLNQNSFIENEIQQLNISARQMGITQCAGKDILLGPNLIQARNRLDLSSNYLQFKIPGLIQSWKKVVQFEIWLFDLWQNDQLKVKIGNQEFVVVGNYKDFQKIEGCSGFRSADKDQESRVKMFIISVIIEGSSEYLDVEIHSSNGVVGDFQKSFGIRNIQVIMDLCAERCQKCVGPSNQECFQCVPNAFSRLLECECQIGYQSYDKYGLECRALPAFQLIPSQNKSQCLYLNQQYYDRQRISYMASYNNQTKEHLISLSLTPSYIYLHDCFKLKLVSLSQNASIQTPQKFYFMYAEDYDSLVFTIPHNKLSSIGCQLNQSENSYQYNCSFRLEFLFQNQTHIQYQFNMISLTNKNSNNTINLALGAQSHKLKCGNLSECTVEAKPLTIAQICSNSTCLSQLEVLNFKVYDEVFLRIRLQDKGFKNAYTVNVKKMLLRCNDGQNIQMNFRKVEQNINFTVVAGKLLLTGKCQIQVISELIPNQKEQQNLIQKTSTKRLLSFGENIDQIMHSYALTDASAPNVTITKANNISFRTIILIIVLIGIMVL